MTDKPNQHTEVLSEDEISNVDLQFMGATNAKREQHAQVEVESQAASIADEPESEGLNKQDVVLAQTMDGSDAPSTNMGNKEE